MDGLLNVPTGHRPRGIFFYSVLYYLGKHLWNVECQ